jgi:hypothetical protein
MGQGQQTNSGNEKGWSVPIWVAVITGFVTIIAALIGLMGTMIATWADAHPTVSSLETNSPIITVVVTSDIDPTQLPVPSATLILVPTVTPTDTQVVTTDSSLGMHVVLTTNRTSGNRPLQVVFDARDSFFIAADGTQFDCGACDYHWQIRKDGQTLFGPSQEPGNFSYTFGAQGTYIVSVYVCRSGSATIENCGGSGVTITVQ